MYKKLSKKEDFDKKLKYELFWRFILIIIISLKSIDENFINNRYFL